ncbi:unnamed protein product [Fraxinus pennsylvanica]|uniref:Uncharacterized protein n=1 Tax=Fraxinus pennsylvanica TaxID=56036 RepID=A0AAD2DZN2_9LAMI|nr:unnamed protein product [Fraxinus pennsylvanica]
MATFSYGSKKPTMKVAIANRLEKGVFRLEKKAVEETHNKMETSNKTGKGNFLAKIKESPPPKSDRAKHLGSLDASISPGSVSSTSAAIVTSPSQIYEVEFRLLSLILALTISSGRNGNKPEAIERRSSWLQLVQEFHESSGRRKTSKYFSKDKQNVKNKMEVEEVSTKRKAQRGSEESGNDVKPSPGKEVHKVEDDDDDEDFVMPFKRVSIDATWSKKLKSVVGKGVAQKLTDESDEDDAGKAKSNLKPIGTTSGGENASTSLTTTTDMDADGSDKEDIDAKTKDLAQKSYRLIKVTIKTKKIPGVTNFRDKGLLPISIAKLSGSSRVTEESKNLFMKPIACSDAINIELDNDVEYDWLMSVNADIFGTFDGVG